MRVRYRLLAPVMAAAGIACLSAPVFAATTDVGINEGLIISDTSFTAANSGGGVTGNEVAVQQPGTNLQVETITLTCQAATVNTAASTSVHKCYLLGKDGTVWPVAPAAFPANASAVQGTQTVPAQPYKACYDVGAVLTDDENVDSGLICK